MQNTAARPFARGVSLAFFVANRKVMTNLVYRINHFIKDEGEFNELFYKG